jgi:peptidoglycan DL-endopeptidase CwlO
MSMSPIAHIPGRRKHASRPARTLVRAGVAGGVLSTLAVTAGAAPASAAGQDPAPRPAETTARLPVLTGDLTAASQQTVDSLQTTAHRYELAAAQDQAAAQAAEKAHKEKKKAEAAARKAAAEKARRAKERASRSADRATLSIGHATGSAAPVIAFLKAQLGKSYVMGATGPSSYDCSGLAQAAFRQVGISLPRTSQQQSTAGTPVPVSAVQPGDLLFWGGVGSAYHVAVYVGGGMYIDAANPSKGVVEQKMSDWPPSSAVRVL